MIEKIAVLYDSHPILEYKEQYSVNFQFIKKRLSYAFDTDISWFEKNNETEQGVDLPKDCVVFEINLLNPILDIELLKKMVEFASQYPLVIYSEGHVPGSQVDKVYLWENRNNSKKVYFSNKQRQYNTQLNGRRLKRVKIFNALLEKFPEFHKMSIEDLLSYTSSDEGTDFVISYGEDVELVRECECPLCSSKDIIPLYSDSGHPVLGFLTKDSEYYNYCQSCELVFMNPHMKSDDLWRYYDEYNFEGTFLDSTKLVKNTLENMTEENVSHLSNYTSIGSYIQQLKKDGKVLDVGGGIGCFCVYAKNLRPDLDVQLLDICINDDLETVLKDFDISSRGANFIDTGLGDQRYDLITNWEVIEHIDIRKLEDYFRQVYESLNEGGYYIFSTPDYKDPLSRSLDFWAMAPGEHLAVYSKSVLTSILERCGFNIIDEKHESVTVKSGDRWFLYGAECNANKASKADSFLINLVLNDDSYRETFRQKLREQNLGSELILILQK
jgi:2-polyprenyl-3-methyl-5-hydroxy-6-metoxy-1,4-benzoquinol methylase